MRELAITGNEYSESNFDIFVNAIKTKIDHNFRTESDPTKTSTRTMLANPWNLYAQWRKSVPKGNKLSCPELYDIYKVYCKKLKGMIRHAKRVYYNKRFDSAKGNMKKKHGLYLMN